MTDTQENKQVGRWGPREPPNSKSNHPWAAVRRRYEWDDSYGDGVAPRDEELEKELFGEENHVNTGINFSRYENIKVHLKGSEIKPISTFNEANLHPVMKENITLTRYTTPTPVQKWSIPVITEGHDLMACAQTGSGKTAAFLIPILSKLFGKAKKLAAPRPQPGPSNRRYKAQPLVLILAPTRELATQIFDECRRFTYRSMLRPCVVYGGADSNPQKAEISKGCDVLTATPGRLCDFLERSLVSLQRVKFLVLDEADRMLDMGFEASIRKIIEKSDLLSDGSRQTLMFSATFPKAIRKLAKDFLQEQHLFLTVGRVGGTTSDITQKIVYVEDEDKRTYLVKLLLQQPPSRTLIFVDTKRGADSLDDFLYNQNFPTTSIHGDRTQREREDALIAFKNGRSPILIATSVAARGLDIKNVMHVINYDLCSEIDEYVHRIGRTARVGNKGLATTFYNEHNSPIAPELVKILAECSQEIPDFLKGYMTENISFDDDYDDDDTPSNDASNRGNFNKSNNQGNSWGNQTKPTNTSSWGAGNEEKQWGGGANEEKQWGGGANEEKQWSGGANQEKQWGGGASQEKQWKEEKQWGEEKQWSGGANEEKQWGGGGANEEKQWDGKAPWDTQPQQQAAAPSMNANAPSFPQQNYMMQNNQPPSYQQQNYQQQNYQQQYQQQPPPQFQQSSVGSYPPPQGIAPPPTYAPSPQQYSAPPPQAQYGASQNPTPGPNYNMPPPQQNYGGGGGYNPQPLYNDNGNGYDRQNNGNQNNGNSFKENSNRSLDSPGRKSNGSPNGLPKHQKNRSQHQKRNGRNNDNNNNNQSNDGWGAPGQDNTWGAPGQDNTW